MSLHFIAYPHTCQPVMSVCCVNSYGHRRRSALIANDISVKRMSTRLSQVKKLLLSTAENEIKTQNSFDKKMLNNVNEKWNMKRAYGWRFQRHWRVIIISVKSHDKIPTWYCVNNNIEKEKLLSIYFRLGGSYLITKPTQTINRHRHDFLHNRRGVRVRGMPEKRLCQFSFILSIVIRSGFPSLSKAPVVSREFQFHSSDVGRSSDLVGIQFPVMWLASLGE